MAGRRKAAAQQTPATGGSSQPLRLPDDNRVGEYDRTLDIAFEDAHAALVPRVAFTTAEASASMPIVTSQSQFEEVALVTSHPPAVENSDINYRYNKPKISSARLPPVLLYVDAKSTPNSQPISTFPLAPDHFLLTLIQYNVLRGLMSNLKLCALTREVPDYCGIDQFITTLPTPSSQPPVFSPTPLQLRTPHTPWLDSVPDPTFRDNLILATTQELYDADDFCNDMCGGLWEGYNDCERRGFLVWGEPWRVESWEVSEGFARKWGGLLRGCEEMMGATNRWRELRGEERIVLEVE